jgi:hypothetical protein
LAAGAGVGSELVDIGAVKDGRAYVPTERAREIVTAVAPARKKQRTAIRGGEGEPQSSCRSAAKCR